MDAPIGRPDAPLLSLGEVLNQYVAQPASNAITSLTGWTPGTTPSWMPQWLIDQSNANKAANAAQAQALAKWGFTPEDTAIAMGFAGPIEAWHGTAADFPKFDPAFAGTGEGSALYGRAPGGYHAEAQATGEAYQEQLRGQLMKTLINAEPEDFLHWNEPLSQQHPDIQAAVNQVVPTSGKDLLVARKAYKQASGAEKGDALNDLNAMSGVMTGEATGEDVYRYLMRDSGETDRVAQQDYATKQLADSGLPGIRYYDDFLHYPGEEGPKSHSYAVFNPDLVEILEKLRGSSWGDTVTGGAR